ncbi:MAG TPA: DUF4954 family protein [Ferruginibacter sp.]|nr:DUF4954 family protein [Ferruginibacter sp.]HRE63130.1 DUF4954 family protein [Ferruginibacter sp.]
MNIINTKTIASLGYHFIPAENLPKGKNEYYLREQQQPSGNRYHPLSTAQIDTLVHNRNTSDNWNNILVAENFNANLVRNCKFYGLIRIGQLDEVYKEFHDFKMPVGLYNSTIISCDFGNNVCIDNVNYLSHYIISDEVMIANVGELDTTNHSKFGNGIVKDGEPESVRTWVEVCNENGGRSILPFEDMLPGDAFLWSQNRDDEALMKQFIAFTQKTLDSRRGYYGTIGKRTVIKNCSIIKDTQIGEDAYIKGANKIKNVTIKSDAKRTSQIGEGCELVNGIVGFGCRIFYGVKAVRFVMASHSQLKYGARLINSYLGNNATISCCEVLNSLIFPSHEQHHNNSFLCASLILGQSNIAAGATIGSNHNSRSPDGEIIAGRGFWPGLCVSLKHNSIFPSFSIIAKGDYHFELNIPIPFSLISNDITNDHLVIMPGYWFLHNMYALERNSWKYKDRDKRTEKIQTIEYDYLAPDTINEIFSALSILEKLKTDEDDNAFTTGWENSKRQIKVVKVKKSIALFKELIGYYGICEIMQHYQQNKFTNFDSFKKSLQTKISRSQWINVGSQLIKKSSVQKLKDQIKTGKINSWNQVHQFYKEQGKLYEADKLQHAYTSLLEINNITAKQFTAESFKVFLKQALQTREWMCKGIYDSRAKDYSNPFRQMVYQSNEEMNKVLGKLEDNSFIQTQLAALDKMKKEVKSMIKKL